MPEWVEGKHPRGADGKFGSGSSGGGDIEHHASLPTFNGVQHTIHDNKTNLTHYVTKNNAGQTVEHSIRDHAAQKDLQVKNPSVNSPKVFDQVHAAISAREWSPAEKKRIDRGNRQARAEHSQKGEAEKADKEKAVQLQQKFRRMMGQG